MGPPLVGGQFLRPPRTQPARKEIGGGPSGSHLAGPWPAAGQGRPARMAERDRLRSILTSGNALVPPDPYAPMDENDNAMV